MRAVTLLLAGTAFIGLLASSWWWLVLPLAVWLTMVSGLFVPVIVAVLIDGYFNAFAQVPYVSLVVAGLAVTTWVLRPYLYSTKV